MWACPSRTRTVNHACTIPMQAPLPPGAAAAHAAGAGHAANRGQRGRETPRTRARGAQAGKCRITRREGGGAHALVIHELEGQGRLLGDVIHGEHSVARPCRCTQRAALSRPMGPAMRRENPEPRPSTWEWTRSPPLPACVRRRRGGGRRRWGEAGHKLAPQARLRWRGATHRGPRRLRRTLGPPYRAERLPRTLLSSRPCTRCRCPRRQPRHSS